MSGEEHQWIGLTTHNGDIHLSNTTQDNQQTGDTDTTTAVTRCRIVDNRQRDNRPNKNLTLPEQGRVDTTTIKDEILNPFVLSGIQICQMHHNGEVERTGHKDTQQVLQALGHH